MNNNNKYTHNVRKYKMQGVKSYEGHLRWALGGSFLKDFSQFFEITYYL